jgi:hypothetical protein
MVIQRVECIHSSISFYYILQDRNHAHMFRGIHSFTHWLHSRKAPPHVSHAVHVVWYVSRSTTTTKWPPSTTTTARFSTTIIGRFGRKLGAIVQEKVVDTGSSCWWWRMWRTGVHHGRKETPRCGRRRNILSHGLFVIFQSRYRWCHHFSEPIK